MIRATFAILGALLMASPASAQDNARVEITIKVGAKTPSFSGQRLVATLHHNHPNQPDRGNVAVDTHVDAKFSHRQGVETVVRVLVGAEARLNPNVRYLANVTVYDAASKVTHISERDGLRGPFTVLNGGDSKLTLIVRPAP